jgi:hypothetical protein
MKESNKKRRRSRTLRVEVLECRALLSTAVGVPHPGAAVAPLARVAQVSTVGKDPVIEGVFQGTGQKTEGEIYFNSAGPVQGVAYSLYSTTGLHLKKTVFGTKIDQSVVSFVSGPNSLGVVAEGSVEGSKTITKFKLNGHTTAYGGSFIGTVKKGSFSAAGSLNHQTGDVIIDFRFDLTDH